MPSANLNSLWAVPDQAGILKKLGHKSMSGWSERFFVLKVSYGFLTALLYQLKHSQEPVTPLFPPLPFSFQGSYLFYFKDRHDLKGFHGCIPLEKARIQGEAPPGTAQQNAHLCITITLNVQHAYIAKHALYVLLAPSPEVHTAWMAALRQAAIPRAALITHLETSGGMAEVVAQHAEQVHLCFPTEGAAVLSSSGLVRLQASREPDSDDAAVATPTKEEGGASKNRASMTNGSAAVGLGRVSDIGMAASAAGQKSSCNGHLDARAWRTNPAAEETVTSGHTPAVPVETKSRRGSVPHSSPTVNVNVSA